MAKVYREHAIQCAAVEWFKLQYPRTLIIAIPNARYMTAPQAMRLLQEGMLKGAPDLIIATPRRGYHGLWIEMKADGGRVSAEQNAVGLALLRDGYYWTTVWSVDQFMERVNWYMRPALV